MLYYIFFLYVIKLRNNTKPQPNKKETNHNNIHWHVGTVTLYVAQHTKLIIVHEWQSLQAVWPFPTSWSPASLL